MSRVLSKIGTVNVISDDSSQNQYERWESDIPIAYESEIYETSGKHYAHYDCEDHIDHIKFMIAGQEPIDGAILVVSAIDGVTPETEEQVNLAQKVNIPNIFVFLNKIDLVKDRELIEINEMEIKELLQSCGYGGDISIVAGSAQKAHEYKGNNLEYEYWKPILELVLKINAELPQPQDGLDQPFLMVVDDVFNVALFLSEGRESRGFPKGKGDTRLSHPKIIEGKNTAVAGTIKRGKLAIGNPLELVGSQDSISTKCTKVLEDIDSLQSSGPKEERQEKRTGYLLKGVEEKSVEKGQVLAKPKSISSAILFEAAVYHLTMEEGGIHAPVVGNDRMQFDFWGVGITGNVALPAEIGVVSPGQNAYITVGLEKAVAMEEGTRFVMNKNGRMVGVGVVIDVLT